MKISVALLWILATMIFTVGCGVSGGGGDSGTTSNTSRTDGGSGGSIDGTGGGSGGSIDGTGGVDTTAPTILATVPCDCGSNIVTDATITALFSEAMQPSSINDSTFTVKNGFKNISGTVSYSGTVATFKPLSNLSPTTVYTASISSAKDMAGNSLLEPISWEFHVGTLQSTARFTDIQGILTSNCISCHTSGGASSFLPLTNDVSYANIVSKPSTYTTGTLVSPGKSQESILYQRVSGAIAGAQMPKGLTALGQADQDSIKAWIDEGALNN